MKWLRNNLVTKISLFFLFAAVVPYLIAGIFFFNSSKKALYGEIVKGLKRETSLIRDALDARLYLLRANVEAWADLDIMNDIITDDLDKRISNELESFKKDYNLAGDVHALNTKGEVIASSRPLVIGKKLEAQWLDDLFSGKEVTLDKHSSPLGSGQVISFAVPVTLHFNENDPVGALLFEYRVDSLIETSTAGDMPAIAIIGKSGEILSSTKDQSIFMQEGLKYTDNPDGQILSSPEYIFALAKSRGRFGFEGFGWTVAAAVSIDQALSPVRKVETMSLALALAGIVTILVLVVFFARRSVKPLTDLSQTARHIAETKDFSSSVSASSMDEVGRLAEAFNGMVDEVKNHIDHISRMEEEMRWADRLSALGELSAGMAHEIKNPLGVIKSSAEILERRLEKGEQEGLLASAISEEATRLSALLESFLQFARPRPPQNNLCQINAIMDKTLLLLDSEISKSGIGLEKSFDKTVPALYTDENQIHQVLVNLIINALQAMTDGGCLSLSTKLSQFPDNSGLASKSVGEAVLITVADTGHGISAEIRDQIFNPFYTTKEKGTGLGLSITFRIINSLGGELKLETSPEGTIFKIYLPVNKEEFHE